MGVSELVEFKRGDIFETDLSHFSMVICYLFGENNTMLGVQQRVLKTLRPGAFVLSVWFPFQEDENLPGGTGEARKKRLKLVQKVQRGLDLRMFLYQCVADGE